MLIPCKHGSVCPGILGSIGDGGSLPVRYSEDCLFIDVYAPAKTGGRKLPVMLWIQGGGFTTLFNPNYDGTGLVKAAQGDLIVVTFNYRVGPYGFLASKELSEEGNLNLGIQDQHAAIEWVQRHISAFGGDADRVTLFGTSIGGGSVLLHLLAYGGNASQANTIKWNAGIAASPYLPSVYTVEEMDFHYTELLQATNCSSLACLRGLPSSAIQAANIATPFPGQQASPLFDYGPVVDGSIFPDRPLKLLRQGRFFKDKAMIIGTSESEGTLFAPQANTTADINTFLRSQIPKLNNTALKQLEYLYGNVPRTYPNVTRDVSPLFYRAAKIYGDASFACPSIDFAQRLSQAHVPVYFFLDRIQDPVEVAAGFIVPHTWEVQAVWGPEYATNYAALPGADSYEMGKSNAAIVPFVQSYWTGFARSLGDPNAHAIRGQVGWQKYDHGSFLSLQTNSTRMETLNKDLPKKCSFWESLQYETEQ